MTKRGQKPNQACPEREKNAKLVKQSSLSKFSRMLYVCYNMLFYYKIEELQ